MRGDNYGSSLFMVNVILIARKKLQTRNLESVNNFLFWVMFNCHI